jgi:hypothetical protein
VAEEFGGGFACHAWLLGRCSLTLITTGGRPGAYTLLTIPSPGRNVSASETAPVVTAAGPNGLQL